MPNEIDRKNIRQANALNRPGAGLENLMQSMTGQQPVEPPLQIVEVVPEDAIVRREDGALVYKRFVLKTTGIDIPADCDGDEWTDVGNIIRALDTSISWVIGDWSLYAMETWGMTAAVIANMFGYDTGTVETYVSVCRSVRGSIRNRASSFGHARLVAKLPEALQVAWLTDAATRKWTTAQLREAINGKPPEKSDLVKQASKYSGFIQKALPDLNKLEEQQRQELIERAEWLAQYYAGIARQARGEDDSNR